MSVSACVCVLFLVNIDHAPQLTNTKTRVLVCVNTTVDRTNWPTKLILPVLPI